MPMANAIGIFETVKKVPDRRKWKQFKVCSNFYIHKITELLLFFLILFIKEKSA